MISYRDLANQLLNAMATAAVAKFILNDFPHATGLYTRKPRTRYRVFLEHYDPYLAELDKRQGVEHIDYATAYSRKQAMMFVQRRKEWSGYKAVRAEEVDH